jgi:hypothetical protein
MPWSMMDLEKKIVQQPMFYVGIRYGSGPAVQGSPLNGLGFTAKTMKRAFIGSELEAGWGSRNPVASPGQYLGDELFDYHLHCGTPPMSSQGEPLWRPEGAPGLILFYLIDRGEGIQPAVAVGVALPLGGPDQFAARKPPSAVVSSK